MTQSTQKRSLVAIVTMFFIFAMISFVTNMAAPFGNIWGFKYEWAGMAGNLMNFTAYLFMGIPAGNMLIRYGYKKTALIALAVGAIGLGIQLLSSVVGGNVVVIGGENPTTLNLFIYLLGALVCGFCVCMLNTVVNPMLNLLGGGGNKGNQLVQAGGTLAFRNTDSSARRYACGHTYKRDYHGGCRTSCDNRYRNLRSGVHHYLFHQDSGATGKSKAGEI